MTIKASSHPIVRRAKKVKPDKVKIKPGSDFTPAEFEQESIPDQQEFYQVPVRFGSVPIDKEPLGWDSQHRFEKVYPRVYLPFQEVERVSFGHPDLEPNRLFFGDNLHVMRMLPSKSIDLIYIDPPFFSGRQYNVLYGDKNELRSFNDIWEGGMPGYLIWLNARLYEMKRLLKDTGSIYVHLDWHASHYVKVEMDKIFGYDRFLNEIVWHKNSGGIGRKAFSKRHDVLLLYSRTKDYFYDGKAVGELREQEKGTFAGYFGKDDDGREYREVRKAGKIYKYYMDEPRNPEDVWEIPQIPERNKTERIGYPTQKPEALLERIIKASSRKGDTVADFFCGGGTTASVAQRLDRKWIASDISRIAIAITADRIAKSVERVEGEARKIQQAIALGNPATDFTIDHWGVYEIEKLGKMTIPEFRKFVIEAYNGRPDSASQKIHGYKNGEPLFVGDPQPDDRITKEEVVEFATTILKTKGAHKGTMIGWAFAPEARLVAEKLAAREGVSLDFVKLSLLPIDSPEFKSHITDKHPTYINLVAFVLPPLVRLGIHREGPKQYHFDVAESASMNANAYIINVQWDFDYRDKFTSTEGYSFVRSKNNESLLKTEYTFPSTGKKKIACRVQDDVGGEATLIKEITVE